MAENNLVVVESPAKARTIGRILGKDFRVMASMGHVRDLPEKNLGIDIENHFEPIYRETRKNTVQQLRQAAGHAKHIYLAPDPDREGEAIAWHLKELLSRGSQGEFHRVVFHEITRSAVNRAFEDPGELDMNLVMAQQARRVLDRLVGYKVSPLLWTRVEKGVSAGRVQSVALRIVCEREREIQAFQPEEYWRIDAEFEPVKHPGKDNHFTSRLFQINGSKAEIHDRSHAEKTVEALQGNGGFRIENVESKPRKRYAPPPFITSTLQQAAGASLRFGANRTMQLAQQLYEGIELGDSGPTGLITYMRTDSVNVAREAQDSCRTMIADRFGAEYVPGKPNFFRNRAGAQGAHEAIRPTDVTRSPEEMKAYLDGPQLKLYTLIWKRFVASQMQAAELQVTTVDVGKKASDDNHYLLRSQATVTVFPGFTVLYQKAEIESEEADNEAGKVPAILAKLRVDDDCSLIKLDPEQKFTEPPPRYSEATLIRELESNGVGRPSTYASIVNTIQKRAYTAREKGKLLPTELGFKVNDFLVENLDKLFLVGFTADMEKKLDLIEEGKLEWHEMIELFYREFEDWLKDAKTSGTPENPVIERLLSIMKGITEWKPAEKRGRRSFDDKKFFSSVLEQYDKNGGISEKQWEALLRLAVGYQEQIPAFKDFIDANGLQETYQKLKDENIRRKEAENGEARVPDWVFAEFFKLDLAPAAERRGRTYDDRKFLESLRQQQQTRQLSDKQVKALGRIALKYRDQFDNFTTIAKALDIDENESSAQAQSAALPAEKRDELDSLLTALGKVNEWAEPVRKGKRVFDDRAFFKSLNEQYQQRRSLSDRQIAALRKLAAKYQSNEPETGK